VYTIEVGPQHVIQFFASAVGARFVTERAPADVRMISQTKKNPGAVGLFAAARPGEVVPSELQEFDRSTAAAEADLEPEAYDGEDFFAGSDTILKHATTSGAHFRDTHRMCPAALGDITGSWTAFAHHCWLSLSGHGWADYSATHSQIFVGSPTGNTIVEYRYRGTHVRTDTVLQGENYTMYAWSGKSDGLYLRRSHRYDIIGDGRHVGVAFVNVPGARAFLNHEAVW
jgi:hypothetical protein